MEPIKLSEYTNLFSKDHSRVVTISEKDFRENVLLPALANNERVTIDFNGVDITFSWIREVFAYIPFECHVRLGFICDDYPGLVSKIYLVIGSGDESKIFENEVI